ncbi:MAG: hypothetical protein ACUZ77_09280, partial [Candidatus Brocadiales bacterium]
SSDGFNLKKRGFGMEKKIIDLTLDEIANHFNTMLKMHCCGRNIENRIWSLREMITRLAVEYHDYCKERKEFMLSLKGGGR